ncbi:MAG: hypothetical protein JO041_02525 [Acidobacteria bacterium]|nr:hypothetical protein [Acidobacteriota bacterium]
MKSRITLMALIATSMLLAAIRLMSQNPEHPQSVPQFSIQKEIRMSGKIHEVKDYSCPVTGTVGTHLELETHEGPIEVHVAAARWLRQYGINFESGQQVEMIGVKGTYEGRAAFLPRIIMVGNDTYYLRDQAGKPLW